MNKMATKGFTLVELLLAMAFFSFILLFITTGFLIINRSYNKGITVKLVQNEGRQAMDRLVREIRSTSVVTIDPGGQCITISSDSYYWSVPVNGGALSPMKLIMASGESCSVAMATATGTDLLHERVGVQYMKVSRIADGGNTTPFYEVHMILSTVETDLLEKTGLDASCLTQSASSGNQYCDFVELKTVVSTR